MNVIDYTIITETYRMVDQLLRIDNANCDNLERLNTHSVTQSNDVVCKHVNANSCVVYCFF